MHEVLIRNWNQDVRPGDDVIYLGDWSLKASNYLLGIVRRVNGNVHLLPGNHERCYHRKKHAEKMRQQYVDAGFASVYEETWVDFKLGDRDIILSHFPYAGDHTEKDRFLEDRPPDTGKWLLHGHVHQHWLRRNRMINVGVDRNDGFLWSAEKLLQIMDDVEVSGEVN